MINSDLKTSSRDRESMGQTSGRDINKTPLAEGFHGVLAKVIHSLGVIKSSQMSVFYGDKYLFFQNTIDEM